jgi:RNA polymerase sigma factor (sigma-70 family)
MTPDDLTDEIPALFRFARALVRDEHLAGDLVQDTLARAIERADQHRNDAPLGAWLRRILRNLAIDRARRSDRQVVVDDIEAKWHDDEYTVDPADVVERASTRAEIEDALARLPFIYRMTVVLHDIEDWTVQEIADLDDVGLPAAKQRLRRGRMALVSALAATPWKEFPCGVGMPANTSPSTSTACSTRPRPSRSRRTSSGAPPVRRCTRRWSAPAMPSEPCATATPSSRPTSPSGWPPR